MKNESAHVYSVEKADTLESGVRKYLQNPYRLLKPYVKEGMTVLDLGCGTGYFSIPMAPLVGPPGIIIAAVLQEGMLAKLKNKLTDIQNVIPYLSEAESIGINEKLDFALAAYVFHELPDQFRFMKEIFELLNEKGELLIIEPDFIVSKNAFQKTINYGIQGGFTVMEKKKC